MQIFVIMIDYFRNLNVYYKKHFFLFSEITNRTGFSMFDVCSEFLMDKPVAGNLVLVKYKDIYIPPEV
jgi:hypothetical protein